MDTFVLHKEERDRCVIALTDYWQSAFQREVFLKLTDELDKIIQENCFKFVEEMTRIEIDGQVQSTLDKWSANNPALADRSRFWVKAILIEDLLRPTIRLKLSEEIESLYSGSCSVDLAQHINTWSDHKIRSAYRQDIQRGS